jgi:hypothetical protein
MVGGSAVMLAVIFIILESITGGRTIKGSAIDIFNFVINKIKVLAGKGKLSKGDGKLYTDKLESMKAGLTPGKKGVLTKYQNELTQVLKSQDGMAILKVVGKMNKVIQDYKKAE